MAYFDALSRECLADNPYPVGSGFASVQDINPVTNIRRPEHWHSPSSETRKQRRPGPATPTYAIPRSEWPTILERIKQGESYRLIVQDYHTSYQLTSRPENPGSGPNYSIDA